MITCRSNVHEYDVQIINMLKRNILNETNKIKTNLSVSFFIIKQLDTQIIWYARNSSQLVCKLIYNIDLTAAGVIFKKTATDPMCSGTVQGCRWIADFLVSARPARLILVTGC